MPPRPLRRWEIALFCLIVLLALALRLYRLDAQSLWNDEGTSVALAQRNLATITRQAAADIHPPLYYYMLHAWIRLTGSSEFGVRLLSALCGALLAAGVFLFARRCVSTAAALLASLFTALSPFHVYYSQETRMYILAALLSMLSMLAFVRWLEASQVRSRRTLALTVTCYVVTSVLAVYSHYYVFTVILAQNIALAAWMLWVLIRREQHWRELRPQILTWLAMQGLIALCYAPWLYLSRSSLQNWPAVSAPTSLGRLMLDISQVFALGVAIKQTARTQLVGLLCAALVLLGLWRSHESTSAPRSTRGSMLACALYLSVPILSMYLLSQSRPMYKPKFLLLATPPYYVLLANGMLNLGRWLGRWVRWRWAPAIATIVLAGAMTASSGLALNTLYHDETVFRDDYRGIVQYIEATASAQDAILINAPSQIETVSYYYRGPLAEYPLPEQRPLDKERTLLSLEQILARHPRIYAIYWATSESDPQGLIESWLDQRCFKALDRWFGNLRLVVYAVPQAPAQDIEHTLDIAFGQQILLRGYTLSPVAVKGGDILQLTLFWQCREPIAERLKVFAHLVDPRGNIVAQRDSEPVGGSQPTSSWLPGEIIRDNYGIVIPPGTPPGAHILRIGLYQPDTGQRLVAERGGTALGDALDLGSVPMERTALPPPLNALDIQAPSRAQWGALWLEGYALYKLGHEHEPDAPLAAGDLARLTLFWRKGEQGPVGESFEVALRDARGQRVWSQSVKVVGGLFPPGEWYQGERVRDIQILALPHGLRAGTYRLTLRPVGWGDGQEHVVTRVTIKP
jgi:mannosyltransferase